MAETTGISWADHTFNPWVGCTKVSPACDGCYAQHLMEGRMHRVVWGEPGKGEGTRARTSEANWKKPLAWNRKAAEDGTRPFVFCASLADVFDNAVPTEWRRDLFKLIHETPNLTWPLLTKRPWNIVKFWGGGEGGVIWKPRNAAIGCTVVSQEEADRDVPKLLAAKAALNPAFAFISMEPLLGPVDIRPWLAPLPFGEGKSARLDWVIAGGETDQGKHKARPSHPDWFRSLRDQCAAAGAPFHFKQWGEWTDGHNSYGEPEIYFRRGEFVGPSECPDTAMHRAGKKRAGRLLDGVLHDDKPHRSMP